MGKNHYFRLPTSDLELYMAVKELRQQNQELTSARLAVERERQRYQDLFEFAPDGYLMTDAKGMIQEVNCAAAALLNMPQQYLVGKELLALIKQSDRPAFRSRFSQIHQVKQVQEWEVRLQPRDRQPLDAALTVAPVCDREGNLLALRVSLRNITRDQISRNS